MQLYYFSKKPLKISFSFPICKSFHDSQGIRENCLQRKKKFREEKRIKHIGKKRNTMQHEIIEESLEETTVT